MVCVVCKCVLCLVMLTQLATKVLIELISRQDQSQSLRYSFKYPFLESNYEERYLATKLQWLQICSHEVICQIVFESVFNHHYFLNFQFTHLWIYPSCYCTNIVKYNCYHKSSIRILQRSILVDIVLEAQKTPIQRHTMKRK